MTFPNFTTEQIEQEEWRDVIGYEGVYSISNLGRVRREKATQCTFTGRLRKWRFDKGGYLVVSLWDNGKPKTKKVHRLVAEAFLDRPAGCDVVNHKDGIKSHCAMTNLEWTTPLGNSQHAKITGLTPTGDRSGFRTKPESRPFGTRNGMHTKPESRANGEKSHFASLTNEQAREIRLRCAIRKRGLIKIIAAEFNVNPLIIYRIASGKTYKDA